MEYDMTAPIVNTGPAIEFAAASSDPNADPNPGEAQGDTPESEDEGTPAPKDGKSFTQAELDQIVKDRVAREKKKTNDAVAERDKLSLRVQELEPLEAATQTDTQRWEKEKSKLVEENESLKAELATRDRNDLVRETAKAKGLPDGFLNRVSGDTPEEIEADVDSLLEVLGESVKAKPAASAKPQESKPKATKATSGGGSSDDDNLPDPKDLAKTMRQTAGQPYFSKH